MKMWLVGMMGTGKTTAGRMAAERLGVPFVDTDDLVGERTGLSIAALWENQGEEAFRTAERMIVAEVESWEGIVATGGGVVIEEKNRAVLARSGTVVWLDARPETMAARVGGSTERPLLKSTQEAAEKILARTRSARADLYAEVANHRIATDDLEPEGVARRIESLWNS